MSLPTVSRPELDELHRDISNYLAAVDAFRAEGCEPSWHPENAADEAAVSAVWAPDASLRV